MRLDAVLSAAYTQAEEAVSCARLPPTVAAGFCDAVPLPEHLRRMGFGVVRLDLGVGIGLGRGFQLSFSLPVELKHFTLEHRLLDGTPYEVPYSLNTGPSEVTVGLADSRFVLRLAGRVPGRPLVLSVALGAALPTGTPSSKDPFDPALPTAQRRHRRSGNGTVDPVLELGLSLDTKPFGLVASGSTRVPVYANPDGYRGSWQLTGSVGLMTTPPAPLDALRLLSSLEFAHSGPARWQGEVELNSGRDSVGLRLGFEWRVKPMLALHGGLAVVPFETWTGDQFPLPVTGQLGLSGTIDLKKAGKREH